MLIEHFETHLGKLTSFYIILYKYLPTRFETVNALFKEFLFIWDVEKCKHAHDTIKFIFEIRL